MKARTLRRRTVDVEGAITPVASDPALVVLATAAIPSLDRVTFAKAASPAPSWAARIVPRDAVGLLNILLEDAGLFLVVVICVNRTSQKLHGVNLAEGVASMAWALTRVETRTRLLQSTS